MARNLTLILLYHYIEKIRNNDGVLQYLYEGKWENLIQNVHNVNILNGERAEIYSYKTRNGYILSFNDDNTKAISFRYSATEEFNTGFKVIRQMIDSQNSDQMENNMDGWVFENNRITKSYHFDSYMGGIKFVNILAEKAEEVNHHPDLVVGWS